MGSAKSSGAETHGSALVMVADHARVRLFAVPVQGAPLQEIEDLVNPSARQHEGDIVSDRSGHLDKGRELGGSSAGSEDGAKKHQADQFAKRAGDRLAALLATGAYRRICLVAEPGFLGLLRPHLSTATHRAVVAEIAKSVTGKPPAELREMLPKSI